MRNETKLVSHPANDNLHPSEISNRADDEELGLHLHYNGDRDENARNVGIVNTTNRKAFLRSISINDGQEENGNQSGECEQQGVFNVEIWRV